MSPLLGRPGLTGRPLLLRSALLLIAILLASTPLSGLLSGTAWLTLTATGAIPVIATGALARRFLRRALLVPLAQILVIAALVLVVELQQGMVGLGDGLGMVTAQPQILSAGVNELAAGLAPITIGARGSIIVVLLAALIALALDLMFIDLGWHTPTGLILSGFILVPALQQPSGGPWWSVAGPVLAAMLILSTRTVHADPRYIEGDRRPQAGPLYRPLRTAAAAITASVLVAGLAVPVGQNLPNVAGPRIALNIDLVNQWQNRDLPQLGPVMIDDDVSVRRSLLDQDPTEVLRYTTDDEEPSYLRLRTLNSFDGETYTASEENRTLNLATFSDARADGLAVSVPDEELIEHDVEVTNLGGNRLPVPENLRELRTDDEEVTENLELLPTNGEVAMEGPARSASGLSYTMLSEENPATAEELRSVDPDAFAAPFESGYTEADDVPQVTADLAASIAEDEGTETAYDTALAFQNFFRTSFAYSLTVRTPPGEDPLESFLSDRVGYCEQFAAAFALMMTAQGYPTRVAIGFTAGQSEGDEWVVESTNAHAWPEVWFGPEHGWVQFEPTPAAANNGVRTPDISDETAADEGTAEETPQQTVTPEDAGEVGTADQEEATAAEEGADTGEESGEDGAGEPPSAQEAVSGAVSGALVVGGIAAGLAAAAAAAVLLIRRRRTVRRDQRWAAFMDRAGGGGAGAGVGADGGGAGAGAGDGAASGGGVSGAGGGAASVAGASGADPAAVAVLTPEAERLRRGAGRMAWSEIAWELTVREVAIRWLSFTGAWGRPPRHLVLDAALPPTQALDRLLDQIAAGDSEVTSEHRAAASRITSAVTASRYAAPVGAAEPAGPAAGRGDQGPGRGDQAPERDEQGPGRGDRDAGRGDHPLRADADLLIDLIRSAR